MSVQDLILMAHGPGAPVVLVPGVWGTLLVNNPHACATIPDSVG